MIAWHRPDMAPEDIQDILRASRVNNEMADEDFASYIRKYVKENDDILNKLGSDYDNNNVPYWNFYKNEQIEGRDNV
jgi:hypothetical protein